MRETGQAQTLGAPGWMSQKGGKRISVPPNPLISFVSIFRAKILQAARNQGEGLFSVGAAGRYRYKVAGDTSLRLWL